MAKTRKGGKRVRCAICWSAKHASLETPTTGTDGQRWVLISCPKDGHVVPLLPALPVRGTIPSTRKVAASA